ncbi:aminotransferase class I/II-fold pyridoxal phosphate-dependent enzyme [Thalassospira povalilytica]|uniref:Aminotransferase class I/II-fold pyridoxal phosphate-dependent enzyme n=1 Tax=Thalassospira povalilytica TaxID=732237 RepID=A0A8I1SIK7_9PROT|nr:aminotransferase class I/II-fold pyridoxal phosphate-dependent enzyme [Thalassospira povalilytica]MBN8195491.1 aminotransferase class I/II-fold pyridoxal phosphate-dependent enzyme [Thalassospira povalilytica]PKR49778.1 aspartate aminotransferase [Thalassospira povalilytica]|tara:strand:- start:522 stop:1712 length:1191 start_codon:yes stop_codon:yes gene_type:complete
MFNERLDQLPAYPFPRLAALLDGIEPGQSPLVMSIGEPQHEPPAMITEAMVKHASLWHKYPPGSGTPELRDAIKNWLDRRYNLPTGMIHRDDHVLPVAGTREALYLIATTVIPQDQPGQKPKVLLPNPFYQVYCGAAVLNDAEMVPLAAGPETGFLPDLDLIDEATLDACRLFFLCSPANPQGAIASADYIERMINLARKHDFVLAMDECYADIYDREAPVGALEICAKQGGNMDNVLVFHSLSKRSSAPGLRSGFVAGDAKIVKRFTALRSYCSATIPMPIMAASVDLWNDDAHAEANRDLYRAKIDVAAEVFGNRFGFYRPPGGFFLWLDVGDDEAATKKIWKEAGVKVIPGSYLSITDKNGHNPGKQFIRIALVHDLATTRDGLTRIAGALES